MLLELAIASSDPSAARSLARSLGGTLYVDERASAAVPFRALATVVTDDLGAAAAAADYGLYLVARRTVKPGDAEVLSLAPVLRQRALTHAQADAHWRDVHGPLALRHHAHMTHYTQLSVLHTFCGTALDGFALCGFASIDDLRERFFSEPDSREIMGADIRKFADSKGSPHPLIVRASGFGTST
jgi:hypothetical protein